MLKFKFSNSLSLNYRFIVTLLIFVIFNIAGLHYDSVFQRNSSQHIKAVGILEELKTSIYKQRHVISYLQMQYESKRIEVDKGMLGLITENNKAMKELVREVQGLNTKGEFGVPSIREIYFESSWRVDEGFTHFSKLIETYIRTVKNLTRSRVKERDRIFFDIEKHGENLLNSLIPIQQELLKARAQYYRYRAINGNIFKVLIILLVLSVYAYLYLPWKAQVDFYTQESQRLKEVLSESELKGNIYSWDLNYYTKELRQSKHLASIFNLVDESEYAFLYDELSCFEPEGRERFLEAIENCIHKDEELEITAKILTKNKKFYWLNYSAKKKIVGDDIWISGTVQDVTALKVAEKRFDDLFHQIEIPLIIFGEGQVRSFNNAAKKFFGVADQESYKLLHPAVMFPLYQEDGRSSLEKLSQSIEDMSTGKVLNDTWSFHTQNYGTITAKTMMFDIMFNDSSLHLIIIPENRENAELERRLVDAYRKAQYAKRSKIEYIVQNGIDMQEMLFSIDKLMNRISSGEQYTATERQIDQKIVAKLRAKAVVNAEQGLRRPLEDSYGVIIFNFEEMIEHLNKRWEFNGRNSARNVNVSVKIHFEKSYFWGDILKIKGLFIGIVENAIHNLEHGQIDVDIYHDTTSYNKEFIKMLVTTSGEQWPGEDWVDLSQKVGPSFEGEVIGPKRVFELVEFLDGKFELKRDLEEKESKGMISASFSVKSVHGKMFKGENEVYFMMNREEYFVPYNESAVSSSEVWTHFDGDWDLIESAIRDFIDYYPQVVADIQLGLEQKDGDMIYNAASELYGVMTHFPFFSSIDRVVLIQKYGEYLRFNEVEEELSILIKELSDFSRVLEEFLPRQKEHMLRD